MKLKQMIYMLLPVMMLCWLSGSIRAQDRGWYMMGQIGFGTLHDVTWSPDGRSFAVASSSGVQFYDNEMRIDTDRTIDGIDAQKIAWQPGGSQLAILTADGITIRDLIQGTEVRDIPPGRAPLVWSPDGKWLAFADDQAQIWLYSPETGSSRIAFREHARAEDNGTFKWVTGLGWSPDSTRIVSSSSATSAYIWDVQTGKVLEDDIGLPTNLPGAQSWTEDTLRVLLLSDYNIPVQVTFENGKLTGADSTPEIPGIVAVQYSPDGKWLMSYDSDYSVNLRHADTLDIETTLYLDGKPYDTYELEQNGVVAWQPDGQSVLVGMTGSLYRVFVDGTSLRLVDKVIDNYAGWLNTLDWSPDSQRLVSAHGNVKDGRGVGDDNRVRVWDINSRMMLWRAGGNNMAVLSATYSPDGTKIAAGYMTDLSEVRIWNAADGALLAGASEGGAWGNSIRWTPDGKSLFLDYGGLAIRRYQISDTAVSTAESVTSSGSPLDISPDGTAIVSQYYAANSDATVGVWSIAEQKPLVMLEGETADYRNTLTVAYSPDGKWIAVSDGSILYNYDSDKTGVNISVYDAATGKLVHTLRHHTDGVTDLDWSPDSVYLASSSRDGTALLWDVAQEQERNVLVRSKTTLTSVAWSPDNKWIAVGDMTGVIYLFQPIDQASTDDE